MATEDEGDADLEPIGPVSGHVQFEDVTFAYEPGVPVLKGITFDAPAG